MTEVERRQCAAAIIARRQAGETYRAIGESYGITVERARDIFSRESRRQKLPDVPDDHDWTAQHCQCARCRRIQAEQTALAAEVAERNRRVIERDRQRRADRCQCYVCGRWHKRKE